MLFVSIEIMSNPELLMQLLMDSTSLGVRLTIIPTECRIRVSQQEYVLCSALKNGTTPECEPVDLIFIHMS